MSTGGFQYPKGKTTDLQGRSVASTAPNDTEVLTWSTGNNQWEPAAAGGGGSSGDWASSFDAAGGAKSAYASASVGMQLWDTVNIPVQASLTGLSVANNRLNLQPFTVSQGMVDRGATLSHLGVRPTDTSTPNFRFGIYGATSSSNLYPGSSVSLSPEIAASGATSMQSWAAAWTPSTAGVYHIGFQVDASWTLVHVVALSGDNQYLLGFDDSANTWCNAAYVTRTYAALPSTFPSSPTWGNTQMPMVFFRWSFT